MTPLIGACLPSEHAATLPSGAIDFLEVNVQTFLLPLQPDPAFAPNLHLAQTSPLPVSAANCFLPSSLKSTGPEAQPQAILTYAATAFARARACGIRTIVFGSGGSRKLPEGLSPESARPAFTQLLRSLGPLAQQHGLVLALEPLGKTECNFILSLAEGAAIVRDVDHPSVRLLADLYHMACNGEPWSTLQPAADLLAHVHVAETARRTPPGVDGDSFLEPFRILKEAGYSGPLSIEAQWTHPATEAPRAAEILRSQWASA
ncbi:MAG: sugar phosphate isomerase/epimerase family protein [Verrucomicrobiia bacterium]